MSFLKVPIQTRNFTVAEFQPHQRLNIDIMGPFEKDEQGFAYILVIIDMFTRWIEIYPLKTTKAEECAEKLFQHFGRFGTPLGILTDNGSQFSNKRIEELMSLLQVKHSTTLAYSKQENGMVERSNKEVMRHVRALVYETKQLNKWSTLLPMVQRIINATKHESTNATPAELLFGRAINLDRGILFEVDDHKTSKNLSQWASNMLSTQRNLIEHAQKTQLLKNQKHMSEQKEPITVYPRDSYVLLEYQGGLRKGPPNKMLTNLKGPYQVLSNVNATYKIRNLRTNRDEEHHISALRPFLYDPAVTDPIDVAIRNEQEFVVQEIKDHRGSARNKTSMQFLVSWKDYGIEEDSWEPWTELRLNTKLHEYLRANNLSSLVPKNLETV